MAKYTKAATTRLMILQKAFNLIYKNGYQATSIDDIIATTQVTKGALFYHFKNKDDMGLAMINEVMYPGMYASMVKPLLSSSNPAQEIYQMMRGILSDTTFFDVNYGCPAVNLIEEMAPLNEKFKNALLRLMLQWQKAIIESIKKGKEKGMVNQAVDPKQVAYFITAGYGGIRNIGKLQGVAAYQVYLKALKRYLDTLN